MVLFAWAHIRRRFQLSSRCCQPGSSDPQTPEQAEKMGPGASRPAGCRQRCARDDSARAVTGTPPNYLGSSADVCWARCSAERRTRCCTRCCSRASQSLRDRCRRPLLICPQLALGLRTLMGSEYQLLPGRRRWHAASKRHHFELWSTSCAVGYPGGRATRLGFVAPRDCKLCCCRERCVPRATGRHRDASTYLYRASTAVTIRALFEARLRKPGLPCRILLAICSLA